jgi:hypothetical protein
MTSLVLFATLIAAQPEDGRQISPAAPQANPFRVQLLPGLMDQVADDVVKLGHQADEELTKAIPDRFGGPNPWKRQADSLLADPLDDIDPKRFDPVLKPAAKAIELWERAARADRADWSNLTKHLRKVGIAAGFPGTPDFETGIQLLAIQARMHLRAGNPVEAIRNLALSLSLIRRWNQAPNPFQNAQPAYLTDQVLDILQDCQAHPRCPSLYEALASLPRPFLTPRGALEGLRLMLVGTLPGSEQIRADPVGTRLDNDAMQRLDRAFYTLSAFSGRRFNLLTARLHLGLAIKNADADAREAMRSAGYTKEVVAATPALNAAILHSLMAGEDVLGQESAALALSYDPAQERMEAVDRAHPRGEAKPGEPGIPSVRFLIEQSMNLLAPFHALERRLDMLRTIEALRLHAHQTGKLPAKLEDIKVVALPLDSPSGKPFDYQLEGGMAFLDSPAVSRPNAGLFSLVYRLRLPKPPEKKP